MNVECQHGVIYNNICTFCGEIINQPNKIRLIPSSKSITFSEIQAKSQIQDTENFMKKNKKLTLLIKLEKVLIDFIYLEDNQKNNFIIKGLEDQFFSYYTPKHLIIRLRPFLNYLLENLYEKFELILLSELPIDVLNDLIKKIDIEKKYFDDRILNNIHIQDKNSFFYLSLPAGEKYGVILDTCKENWLKSDGLPFLGFIYIHPYNFFIETSNIKVDQQTFIQLDHSYLNENVLIGITKHLIKIHYLYFEENFSTLLDSISYLQISLFKNKRICSNKKNPNFLILEKLLSKFGGTFFNEYDSKVTHLIINSLDDEYINEANKYIGVYIITIEWIIDSIINYEIKDENLYKFLNIESPTKGNLIIEPLPTSGSDLSSFEFDKFLIEEELSIYEEEEDDENVK